MTAAEHLAEAEKLLDQSRDAKDSDMAWQAEPLALAAIGNALIAIADGLGIAHAVPAGG